MKVPAGYRTFPFPGGYAFAHASLVGAVHRILADGGTLHDWAARRDAAEPLGGRAVAYSVPAPAPGPDGRARWVVRRYRRGGAASWLGAWYRRGGESRPVLELRASDEARSRGVPTPAVTAGAFYPVGAAYRADLATELVPDARSLAARLFTGEDGVRDPAARARSGALGAAGRLTRLLEDARVLHADLNAHNVILREEAGRIEAHAVDLDRSRALPAGAPPPRGPMRRRLERSLRKLGEKSGPPLTAAEWDVLRAGFEADG